MEGKSFKTTYFVKRIIDGCMQNNSENMEFEECKFCHEIIPAAKTKCSCGAEFVHACQSTEKKEVIIGNKTELLEIRKYSVTQSDDGCITYYYECQSCKDHRHIKLKIAE